MSYTLYHTTALEDWVSRFYKQIQITKPDQIHEDYIAKRWEIFIKRAPLPSNYFILGRFNSITIDTRKNKLLQREMFFHELCHVLRHYGVQGMMPEAFRELQERDARNFVRYAAIPHHMLQYINLNDSFVHRSNGKFV